MSFTAVATSNTHDEGLQLATFAEDASTMIALRTKPSQPTTAKEEESFVLVTETTHAISIAADQAPTLGGEGKKKEKTLVWDLSEDDAFTAGFNEALLASIVPVVRPIPITPPQLIPDPALSWTSSFASLSVDDDLTIIYERRSEPKEVKTIDLSDERNEAWVNPEKAKELRKQRLDEVLRATFDDWEGFWADHELTHTLPEPTIRYPCLPTESSVVYKSWFDEQAKMAGDDVYSQFQYEARIRRIARIVDFEDQPVPNYAVLVNQMNNSPKWDAAMQKLRRTEIRRSKSMRFEKAGDEGRALTKAEQAQVYQKSRLCKVTSVDDQSAEEDEIKKRGERAGNLAEDKEFDNTLGDRYEDDDSSDDGFWQYGDSYTQSDFSSNPEDERESSDSSSEDEFCY